MPKSIEKKIIKTMRSPANLYGYVKFCETQLLKGINGETYVSPAEVRKD